MTKHYLYGLLAVLIIAVLAGCSAAAPGSPLTVEPSEQVGIPTLRLGSSSAIDLQPFTEMAAQASCARDRNRLYVIDGEMVLWETRDLGCADASYGIRLFGASPDEALCRNNDSIAGPMLSCDDESARTMFETIIKHTEEADLGLGADHMVELAWRSE